MPRGPLLELEGDELVFTHNKEMIEEYTLKAKSGFAWAVITLGNNGSINIQSDYGDFSYRWTSPGPSFKHFIMQRMKEAGEHPTSYLYDKIKSTEREGKIELKKTISNLKNRILEKRMEAGAKIYGSKCTEYDARGLWDALTDMERNFDSEVSQDLFYSHMSNMSELKEDIISFETIMHNYDDDIIYSYDRNAMAFCMYIAPAFADILKKELEENNDENKKASGNESG